MMIEFSLLSFKPYYNWNTFNTMRQIQTHIKEFLRFKPYYNWNTFNTVIIEFVGSMGRKVLNLIITGIPSIQYATYAVSTIIMF